MTDRKTNNIFILVVFTIYVAIYRLFISRTGSAMGEFINVAAIVIIAFISILLLGFRKDRLTTIKKAILGTTITEILIFIVISYAIGYFTGYSQNTYSLNPLSIFENLFLPITYIVGIEIFRYTVLNANSDNKDMMYVVTFLIILLELSMGLQNVLMYNFETIFTNTAAIIIPIIIKNATISYLTVNGGLKPVLFYRLTMDIYKYVMPFTPDLGDYLTSVLGILLPTMVYMYSARLVDAGNDIETLEEKKESKKTIRIGDIPVFIFIVVLVVLISGKFKYSIIGVGSESMSPTIQKGDAVVYEKVDSIDDLKIGDVLVFKSGSKMIIHRYTEKKADKGNTYIITKGDANNSSDNLNLTIKDVEGKVKFKVKYLAYPSLWLKDMIDKKR